MSSHPGPPRQRSIRRALVLALVGVSGLALGACGGTGQELSSTQAATASPPPMVAVQDAAPAATDAPVAQKLLKVDPVKGFVGDSFTIAGQDLPPGQAIEFQWVTRDGSYVTEAVAHDVLFQERKFAEKRTSLGRAPADADGRVAATFTAPEDYGEVHDIYAVVEGKEVARGGFRILRSAIISSTTGPVGTPITVTVQGIGWQPFENTMALRYDNKYTGFVSAVTTRGTAVFQIRAAGPVGRRTIQLTGASPGLPYLNLQQSNVKHVPMDFRFTFTVTEDAGPPPDTVAWPESARAAAVGGTIPPTTAVPGVSAFLEPAAGPVMVPVKLKATGLPASAEVGLRWVTGGIRALPSSSQDLPALPLLTAKTAPDGSLAATFLVTDDRGGWQRVRVVQGASVLAEVPFYVERSLVAVGPKRLKGGDTFAVQIKGGGWTELDKGVAVTYDNAYAGFACSVSSSGDITLNLVATGAPGTHLIDLYPMIYRQKGSNAPEFWNFELPHLTGLTDHPGLALGYRIPIFRLAIEIVE